MATKPPLMCPLCHEELDATEDLEAHLLDSHAPRELAEAIATRWEEDELGDESE